MRVVRLMDEPDWQSRLSPIEEIFFATSPSAKTLRPDERAVATLRTAGKTPSRDFFPFFGDRYNRPPPAVDYSKAPPPRKLETRPASTVVIVGERLTIMMAHHEALTFLGPTTGSGSGEN